MLFPSASTGRETNLELGTTYTSALRARHEASGRVAFDLAISAATRTTAKEARPEIDRHMGVRVTGLAFGDVGGVNAATLRTLPTVIAHGFSGVGGAVRLFGGSAISSVTSSESAVCSL